MVVLILDEAMIEDVAWSIDSDAISILLDKCQEKYGEPSCGSSRYTFMVSEDWVVKVPLARDCIRAQYTEAQYNNPEVPVAKNWVEFMDGVPVVWMERVKPIENRWQYGSKHPWSLLRDGPQIGYNKDGELVAYDLGYEDHFEGDTYE
jgi:hypothetical protein